MVLYANGYKMWYYNEQPIDELPPETVGFVYIIENIENGKKYIGKKLATSTRTKKVKGKKVKSKTESNWKSYYGSNESLLLDVEKLGPSAFRRKIIRFCSSKSELSYYEAKLQFEFDVLLSEEFYNGWIMVRVRGSQLKKK
jgi:Putative endonuclease segE, GIY-YIG domain